MTKKDPFDSIYLIENKYFDPYEVLNIVKSAPEDEKNEIISQLKERGFTSNRNISDYVDKYEYLRSMSS